jgi:hypothetical protein
VTRWTAECPDALPCTVASCRYHLEAGPGCALAAAEEGPRTLDEIGELLGVTGESVRTIEGGGLATLGKRLRRGGIGP